MMPESNDGVALLVAPLSPTRQASAAQETRRRAALERLRFVGGLLLLALVVLLWVFSSVLTQFLYDNPDVDYKKPTALTTLCTATASVFLLPGLWKRSRCGQRQAWQDAQRAEGPSLLVVVLVTLNWFFCQWTFNLSLMYTALSTNTLLSSSSVVWSYVVGLAIGTARLSALGVGCVCCGMGGVAMAVLGQEKRVDPSAPVNTPLGEVLAMSSAIAYGVFSNGLAARVRPEQMSQVWGGVGLFSLLLGAALMALGHLTGLEPAEVPSGQALSIMLLNGFLGTSISDYMWARGLLLTSPLVATVALNLTIPVSFVTDAVVLRQHAFSWIPAGGACLVFAGVVLGAVDEQRRQAADQGAEQGAEQGADRGGDRGEPPPADGGAGGACGGAPGGARPQAGEDAGAARRMSGGVLPRGGSARATS